MSWVNVLGYAASVAVLATFCMSTMIPLRIVALASNLLFCSYGYLDHLYPVLFLHAALFPVNLWRLTQFQRLVRDVRRSHRKDLSLKHLLPYMKKRSCAAGGNARPQGRKSRPSLLPGQGGTRDCRHRQGTEARRVLRGNRRLRPEPGTHGDHRVPHRLPPVRTVRMESQGALFPGPVVRIRRAAADHRSPAREQHAATAGGDGVTARGR